MKENPTPVFTSMVIAPLVPQEIRFKHAIISFSSQRTVGFDAQSDVRRRRPTQSALLIAITENKSVESHMSAMMSNRYWARVNWLGHSSRFFLQFSSVFRVGDLRRIGKGSLWFRRHT